MAARVAAPLAARRTLAAPDAVAGANVAPPLAVIAEDSENSW